MPVVAAIATVVGVGYGIYAGERANAKSKKAQKAALAQNKAAVDNEFRAAEQLIKQQDIAQQQTADSDTKKLQAGILLGTGALAVAAIALSGKKR